MTFPTHIFKAYDIRGEVDTELTPELCENIGRAFADWLTTKGPIAVGRDMRPDSGELADAVILGLRKQGRTVWDLGQITSDMGYFAVGKYNLAGVAVVTASHNPGKYNGIKLYRDQVIAVGLDCGLSEIRDMAHTAVFARATVFGSIEKHNIVDDWVIHAMSFVDTSMWQQYRIAIDTGNGMAGAILPKILPQLPLDVEELYFELDGTFPNHEANPQNVENLHDLIATIEEHSYDFGIAFDGDGDRAVMVDDKGRPVLGSDAITLVSRYMLKKYPHAKIVYDVRTSRATKEFIEQWGGTPIRTKAGRVNIGTKEREVGAPFGGETSGHLFFKENYDADSGLIGALVMIQAIAESGKKLSELIDEYRLYVMPQEINFIVQDSADILKRLKQEFADGEQDELDGLTVNYPDYWFNIRVSNTEPVMRLNLEGKTQAQVDNLISHISKIIKT